MDKISKKLKDTAGETIIETLVSLVIACLGLLLLPGAIVAAAKTNRAAEKYSFYAPGSQSGEGTAGEENATIVTDGTISIDGVSVNVKITTNTRGTGDNKTTFYSYSLPKEEDASEDTGE